jgi:hypothetical protein
LEICIEQSKYSSGLRVIFDISDVIEADHIFAVAVLIYVSNEVEESGLEDPRRLPKICQIAWQNVPAAVPC